MQSGRAKPNMLSFTITDKWSNFPLAFVAGSQASFSIREHQAGAEQTLLSAGFPVDYDLFVNALYDRTMQFLAELETTDHA